jgi:hypothetical protein
MLSEVGMMGFGAGAALLVLAGAVRVFRGPALTEDQRALADVKARLTRIQAAMPARIDDEQFRAAVRSVLVEQLARERMAQTGVCERTWA